MNDLRNAENWKLSQNLYFPKSRETKMTHPLLQDNKNLTGTPASSPNNRPMGHGSITVDTALNLLMASSSLEASSSSCSHGSPPQQPILAYANHWGPPLSWERDQPSCVFTESSRSSPSSCSEVLAVIDSVLDILEEPIGDI